MSQRKDILEINRKSRLKANEPPLSFEPRILRSSTVRRDLSKELSKISRIDGIQQTNMEKTLRK